MVISTTYRDIVTFHTRQGMSDKNFVKKSLLLLMLYAKKLFWTGMRHPVFLAESMDRNPYFPYKNRLL